jgi:hypothetical protein
VTDIDPAEIGDLAEPDLATLQQREPVLPTVPVQVDGIVRVLVVPAHRSAVETFPMDTTLRRLTGADPRRSRAVLVSASAWNYGHSNRGQTVAIPASVPITITHADEIWVSVPTSTANLSVIYEYQAD